MLHRAEGVGLGLLRGQGVGIGLRLGDGHGPEGTHHRQRHVRADPAPDCHPYAQLFRAFAGQRLSVRLPRLDLSARELPAPGDLRRGGTLTGEHPTGLHDHRCDNHPG